MSSYAINAIGWLENRLPVWAWRLVSNREWQKTTALSIVQWFIGAFVVYELIEGRGYGWQVKVIVALAMDGLMYVASKLGIWPKRQTTYLRSYALWLAWWAGSFVFNTYLAWKVLGESGRSTLVSLGILAVIGVIMNPIVFKFRDKIVFKNVPQLETETP